MTDRDELVRTVPRRAVVLVDVQNEYARLPLRIRYPRLRDCMEQIERVLDAAESAGLPVVCVQHAGPPGGAIFAPGGKGFELCPSIERRRTPQWKSVVKHHGSIYAGTDLAAWLHEQGVNTVTLVGFMVNNCVLASAAWGETIGLATEVLSDAVGAINLRNRAGKADARTVHTTLMALLHSNWAAVATTDDWCRALGRDAVSRCRAATSSSPRWLRSNGVADDRDVLSRPGTFDAVVDISSRPGAIDAYGDSNPVPARARCPRPEETAPRRAGCPRRCARQRGQQQRGSP